ncbi:Neuralized-like protein 4 [Exaiptasia diaphana]|nr:Neuralized-like protein 4 [Exaiptasia diaphana]
MVSPTVMCVTCTTQLSPFQYRDVTTGETYEARVAFRVCVKPGSYGTGRASCCTQDTNESLLDHNLGTQELEWYLEEKGLVALTALLIKIEPT